MQGRGSSSNRYRPLRLLPLILECRKWGLKTWGLNQIGGYLRKKALPLFSLKFLGAARALRKRAKNAEKGRKMPISADFSICCTPICGSSIIQISLEGKVAGKLVCVFISI